MREFELPGIESISTNNLNKIKTLLHFIKSKDISRAVSNASIDFNKETADLILTIVGLKKIVEYKGIKVYEDIRIKLLNSSLKVREDVFLKTLSHKDFCNKYEMVTNEILQYLDLGSNEFGEECSYGQKFENILYGPIEDIIEKLSPRYPTQMAYAFSKTMRPNIL